MTNSRTKGASAERELARLLHEQLGIKLVRNLEQSRHGGHDLVLADGTDPAARTLESFAIEVKRYRAISAALIAKWWLQTVQQAERAGKIPCLTYRADRQPWRVVLPMSAVNPAFPVWDGIDWTVELSIAGFCAVVREGLSVTR